MSIKKSLILSSLFLMLCSKISFGQTASDIFSEYNVEGSFTLYDLKNNNWYYTDEDDANTGSLPASTFKILNSLIALEGNVIASINDTLRWDGKEKSHLGTVIPAWNQDTDMRGAFKNSTIWFYEELSKRIGKDLYRSVLKKINYGSGNIDLAKDDFWNYGDFKVTPKNQIEFLIMLSKRQLPFSNKNISTVTEMMVLENEDNRVLRGKTGWTAKDGNNIGWFIGYLTYNGDQYFFATRIKSPIETKNNNFGKSRIEITNKFLKNFISLEPRG